MNNDTATKLVTQTQTPPARAPESSEGDWMAHLARVLLVTGTAACVLFPISPAEGLMGGACIALLFGNPVAKLTHRWSGLILQIAVVLMGAGMNLGVVWRVGASGVAYTVIGIALTMMAGLWLGRRYGLGHDVALLVSAGTAICGGSAIAAMSAATKPKAHDVAVSLGSIFLLTALGMLVFPLVGHALGFSQEQFGMWAALALHDTSSVVGAATTYGATALGIAVTVKLTRALWIVPLTAAMGWWHEKKMAETSSPRRREKDACPAKPAWRRFEPQPFIIWYLVMAAVFTYVPAWVPALGGVFKAAAPWCGLGAHRFLTLALFLIGAGLSREALRKTGVRPLKMAGALWVFVSVVTALALWAGWIVAPRV